MFFNAFPSWFLYYKTILSLLDLSKCPIFTALVAKSLVTHIVIKTPQPNLNKQSKKLSKKILSSIVLNLPLASYFTLIFQWSEWVVNPVSSHCATCDFRFCLRAILFFAIPCLRAFLYSWLFLFLLCICIFLSN